MKLNYDKKSKNPTYFGQVGIRNGKKVTSKNVVRIGTHQELLKITDDPLAYAKAFIEKENQKGKENKKRITVNIDFDKKLTYTGKTVSSSKVRNIGYLFLSQLYYALDLKKFFKDIQAESKIEFDCDTINRFLTVSRILYPESKLGTYNHRSLYYEEPEFEYHQILRFMDVLYQHYDSYIEHLFEGSGRIVPRDTSVCYYDVTNYYCESEYADSDTVDEQTGELIQGLRVYGHSKEHRPNPIVQMGLFMDGQGIPLSMCVHPGNTNEQVTALPLEKKLTKMFKGKKFIYCADGGINSYDIRLYNSFSDRAFVVTQSLSKLSEALQEAVLNDCDYKTLSTNKPASLVQYQTFDKEHSGPDDPRINDILYKVIPADKAVDLGLTEEKHLKNGKTKMVKSLGTLKQQLIISYSRKVAEYQKNVRDRQIKRAEALIASKSIDEIKSGPNDVKRFIKRTSTGKSGETAKDCYELDTERIKNEARFDGFYALATNMEADTEQELAREVIGINAGRYRIEDCFRILKTNFNTRPIFHRTTPRIIAHFLICYTALLVYRLLEVKLNSTGAHYTTAEILETLRNMGVVNNQDLYYSAVFESSNICTSLNEVFNLGLDKEYYEPTTLNKLKRPQYLKKKNTSQYSEVDGENNGQTASE